MRKICSALAILLCSAAALGGESPTLLARYSFDDDLTHTGPDTFAVFQHSKGHVRVASDFRLSGYNSLELHDVADDGDFPELQGYFPERKKGMLFFHFAMLVVNPDQQLNVALAGPSWFSVTKNGIAFWLKTVDGQLVHVSDSIPKKLFRVDPFVWYQFDVRYDIDKGTYDLAIRTERSRTPVVDLKDQPNSANAALSSVDKFSFVGSVFTDDSNITYYVDDIALGTDEKIVLGPFVAPGRRKLFIDRWKEAKVAMMKQQCPPASLADFESEASFKSWRTTCDQMEKDPAAAALAFASLGDTPIYRTSEVIALMRAKDRVTMKKRFAQLDKDDPRYGIFASIANLDDYDYFDLLVEGNYTAAAALAEAKNWPERAGDALFLGGSHAAARPWYEAALRKDPNAYWPTTKLSDIFHLQGDIENEKKYRQKMYGKLE